VFMGEGRMAPHAAHLGVQHWNVRVCARGPVAQGSRKVQAVASVQAVPHVQPRSDAQAVASTPPAPDTPRAPDTRILSLGGPDAARAAPKLLRWPSRGRR